MDILIVIIIIVILINAIMLNADFFFYFVVIFQEHIELRCCTLHLCRTKVFFFLAGNKECAYVARIPNSNEKD